MRIAALLLATSLSAAEPARRAALEVTPTKAKLGDPLAARITLTLAPGDEVDPAAIPPSWGKAEVLSGSWVPAAAGESRRVWSGTIAVYELGTVELPPLTIPVATPAGPQSVETAALGLTIEGVLEPADPQAAAPPEIADLKPAASIPPDYAPLRRALAGLAGLLAVAAVAWWLHRRYASRFAAAAVPEDPFRKMPPHVWVYRELERLLARRLAEEGKVGEFYDELTHVMKRYLEGRYRIDLLDRTTSEVPAALQQAGAPGEAARIARALLDAGDLVKFARSAAGPQDCRASVDEAYRLVDLTKPIEGAA